MIELIIWPLVAAMVLTSIRVYLGLQVVRRGVIFVDLALAQVAALGSAVGILLGLDPDGMLGYLLALGFTFLGATLFAFIRSADRQVPQEAIIGITYVVAAALMILLFSQSAEGAEQINHLLVGSILFVTPEIVGYTTILYLVIGAFHWKYRHQFLAAAGVHGNQKNPLEVSKLRFWDFLFYVSFGFVVTNSVKIAGVLLVFSFLIIPTVASMLFRQSIRGRLIFGLVFSMIGSFLGVFGSLVLDIPTGATMVVSFGFMLALLGLVRLFWN